MPALNYMARLAPLVKSGAKYHTIRALRARVFAKGDTLMHYTGMRSKACRKIRKNTLCIGATRINIDTIHGKVFLGSGSRYYYGGLFGREELQVLARVDGFESVEEFFRFFLRRSEDGFFHGQLIEWQP